VEVLGWPVVDVVVVVVDEVVEVVVVVDEVVVVVVVVDEVVDTGFSSGPEL
jgi:hypothetical protein